MKTDELKNRGFSLIELLVVIAVIGILISLLLPAVQSAREAARRIQCRNNMKQLSLAVINYEGAHKCYPPAGLVGPRIPDYIEGSMNPRNGQMISWVVLVLPFMEEQSLYQQFDLSQSVLTQNGDPQTTPVKTMICPSDETEGRFYSDATFTNGKRFAKGNYAAFVSPVHVSYADWWPAGLSGVHRHGVKDIVDGTSSTLLLSEVRTRDNEQDQRGAWALPWTGSTLLSFDMHPPIVNEYAVALHLNQMYLVSDLSYKAFSSYGEPQLPNTMGANDMLYNCSDQAGAQLDGMPCVTFQHNYDAGWLSAAPRSKHLGGVNVTFLDGRIGFIPDSIDQFVMANLISSNDGQNVDLSQLR
jgi:prepilin-type N-terminal cleavage/methylation domain-containing protein/prepilin-type processing-associated H-X9-DG protein